MGEKRESTSKQEDLERLINEARKRPGVAEIERVFAAARPHVVGSRATEARVQFATSTNVAEH